MLTVHCHAHGLTGGSNGPTRFDFECVCIEDGHIILLFIVVEDRALTIGNGIFYPAAHGDDFYYCLLDGIDGCGVFAVAIKGEDELGRGIVDNRVRIGGGFDSACDLKGLKVEHRHVPGIAISDKSLPELGHNKDTVAALQSSDCADYRKI